MDAGLGRRRKFAIVMGILLLTWAVAGIEVGPEGSMPIVDLPFRIRRAELVPLGLALGSFYGAVSYFYYGMMLGTSPFRRRRDLVERLVISGDEPPRKRKTRSRMPTRFSTTPARYDRAVVETEAQELRDAFPKGLGARVQAKVKSWQTMTDDGDITWLHQVETVIPIRCRIAAVLEDIDYTMPVWFNVVALGALAFQLA